MTKKKGPFSDPDSELSYESDNRMGQKEPISGDRAAAANGAVHQNALEQGDATTAYLDETGAFADLGEEERKELRDKNMFFNTTQNSE